MTVEKVTGKKYYTVAEANAALPLVRAIVRDIAELANALRERHLRMSSLNEPLRGPQPVDFYQEEVQQMQADMDRDQERLQDYIQELSDLGIELKDPLTGLIDFPCWMGHREVYLCWRLGEPEVAYWHELDAGFAGRQRLKPEVPRLPRQG